MPLTNYQALKLALWPGAAETLEAKAKSLNNQNWIQIGRHIRVVRNVGYAGTLLITISILGVTLGNPDRQSMFSFGVLVSSSITGLALKVLYDNISYIQQVCNR